MLLKTIKDPLCYRIPHLDPAIPITFIYGDSDWMDVGAAQAVKRAIDLGGADDAGCAASAVRAPMSVHRPGPHSGHQLHIDNPWEFNDVVIKALVAQEGRRSEGAADMSK